MADCIESYLKGRTCPKVCSAFIRDIGNKSLEVRLHSSFDSAANLESPLGLITLLKPWKCLQPYSVVIDKGFSFDRLQSGGLVIRKEGIWINGRMAHSFAGSQNINLRLEKRPKLMPGKLERVNAFLEPRMDKGLVQLAFGRETDIYAVFLAPRLLALRSAVKRGDDEGTVKAAWGMAGCGPGLTPSSDDLLCGYLIYMPDSPNRALAKQMAEAAAKRTNDISASLLRRAGERYFSEDILNLVEYLGRETTDEELTTALKRVADFGSSSGLDFLTGMYFGILDFYENGGIGIEETGNS